MSLRWYNDPCFPDNVARSCISLYTSRQQTGKPQANKEWTLLAAIIVAIEHGDSYKLTTVAIGTGSKCIGKSKMSKQGDVLNDSHAEVLARRAFICYLLGEVETVYGGGDSEVLSHPTTPEGRCRVRDGVSFHLYTSHTPCGDASIFPKEGLELQGHDSMSRGQMTTKPADEPIIVIKGIGAGAESEPDRGGRTGRCPCNAASNCVYSPGSVCSCAHENSEERKRKHSGSDYNGDPHVDPSVSAKVVANKADKDCAFIAPDKLTTKSEITNIDAHSSGCLRTPSEPITGQDIRHGDHVTKRRKTDSPTAADHRDIYRTGAKCAQGGVQDPHGDHEEYHVTGAFRIKPGRGERTLSMSCSDKMARWNIVGCQGALLSHLLAQPVYLETVTVGRCPMSVGALQRAVVDRSSTVLGNLPDKYTVSRPRFYRSSFPFQFSRHALMSKCPDVKIVPAPTGVAWFVSKGTEVHDVTVNGRRQGVTAKNIHKPEARSAVCSKEVFRQFLTLKAGIAPENLPLTLRNTNLRTYKDFKMAATDYQTAWRLLLETFPTWEHKPPGYLDYEADT